MQIVSIKAYANHGYFDAPYAALNKCVLRAALNVVMEGASLTDSDKLFQAVGPATANARLSSSR